MLAHHSIWTALSDPKRRQIITLLEEKPRTTSELSAFFDVSRFAIMKHLKVLEAANLIDVRRDGRLRWNVLNPELAHLLRNKLSAESEPEQLAALVRLIPGEPPNASVGGHKIETAILVDAHPATLFNMLVTEINRWWPWRLSPDSHIVLELDLDGRLYESLHPNQPSDHQVLLGLVTTIHPDSVLRLSTTTECQQRLSQTVGPPGHLCLTISPTDGGAHLTVEHYFFTSLTEKARQAIADRWQHCLTQQLKPLVIE